MNKDNLQSIDDSALEAVSGGHVGVVIEAVAKHVAHAVDHFTDAAGEALQIAGGFIKKLGERIAD